MKTSPLAAPLAVTAMFGSALPSFAGGDAPAQPDLWQLLSQIEITEVVGESSYELRKSFPPGLEADRDGVQITGYAVALVPGGAVRELILTSDMGNCPMCGGFGHGATLQVTLDTPVIGFEDGQRITVLGTLNRVDDRDSWQAARLTRAQILPL